MYESSSGRGPGRGHAARAGAVALLLAMAAGGCSSTQTAGRSGASWSSEDEAYRVAYQAPPPRIEFEDDGMEAQVPPPKRIRDEPDDPSEPFSPNYGSLQRQAGVPATAPLGTTAAAPVIPDDRPRDVRRRVSLASGE